VVNINGRPHVLDGLTADEGGVYRINDHARTVSILDIDHRADVYRPR